MSSAPPSTATPSKAVPSLPAPSAPVPSGSGRPAPYKLFDYFDEDDKDRFYGREQDIEEIVDRIAAGRTLVLYGRSGIGKTSLLRAGVIPRLAARGFQVAYVRLLRAPLADLRAQVAAALGAPQGSLASMLRARREPVVILLDQLEELFIRFPDEAERRALAEELSASLTATDEAGRPLDLRLVLSLRQDWVAELDELGPTFADLLDRRYRLKGLSAFGARRAIAQPLAEKKIAVAPGLVNALVDDLSDKGFDPLLLQILCSEVYRAAERRDPAEIRLTVDDYQAVGGTAGIFLRYLDGVTAAVPEGERILLRLVLDALITEERTKRAMTLDGLLAARFRAERGEVHAVLERLRDGRLLRTMPRGDETWYELVHDRLVEVVLGWLERDRDFVELRFARSLVEELAQSGRWRDDPHALLSRGQIESAIGPYRGYLRLAEEEEAFLLQSAVVARSEEELGFWAARVGLGRSAERVLALCDHEVASVRGGAAWACSALPERDPRFAARCLLLSLHDPDGGVRRTAGKSFAIIATDAEIARLRADMEAPATRAAATELLADVIRRDRSLTGFSRRQRAAARRVAEKRVRVRFSEELSVRERTGAITGAIAAAVWVATIGLALAASTTILIDPTDYTTDVVWSIIVALPLIVAPAAGAADLAVRAAFYAEHLDRRSGLSRIARSRAVAPWYAVPLFICSVFPPLEALGESGVEGWLIAIAAALAITAITVSVVSASVAIGERALAERSSAAAVAGAALGAALGLPLGVPSLATRALMVLVPWHSEAILAGGALAAAAGSASTAALLVVLGRDARRKGQRDGAAPPAAPDARGRRRAARALLVALPAALLGWGGALLHGRPDALPFTAPAVKLRDLGEARAIPMPGGFPEAHWLRLDSGDDPRASLFVVEAEKTPGMTLPSSGILPFVSSIAESPMLLVVPPDARSYLISWSHDQPGSFRLGPARPLRTMEPVVLRDERPVYRLATLAHEAGTGLWSGRISGTIEGAGGRRATMAALGVILRAGANTLTAEVQPMSPNAPGGRKALGVYLAQTRSVLSVLQPSGEIIDAPGDGSFTTRDLVVDLGYPSSVGGDPKAITDVELIIALWLAVPPPARAPQP